jgi:hypothetical protein
MRQILLLIALSLAATAVQAQAVFRSMMPDGSIVYGDAPAPGAKETTKITLPPSNVVAPTPQPAPAPASAPASAPQKQDLDRLDADVKKAEQELQAAKAALEAGRESQEGDRIGTKGGFARLSEAYFERIKSLEAAVAAAQDRLDAAYAKRNAAR